MMPILLKIKAGGQTETEEYPLLTERFLYVLKGAIAIYISSEIKNIKQGEAFYFNASRSHYLKNPTKSEAQALSIITPVSL
jgi:mannose-6-phosphate isomerase-like protein (cupin superfamily)